MSLTGEVYESPTSGTRIRLLLEEKNLGGNEIEIGEITFPPGVNSGEHLHGATEIFYILSGELEHVVDGKSHLLEPGMLGFVRPPAKVNHVVPGDEPVKALVIWAPGGEAHRIVDQWKKVE
ncbi:MAG: cupin domain-containing protein, partial [Vicinamibacteria bacterium]